MTSELKCLIIWCHQTPFFWPLPSRGSPALGVGAGLQQEFPECSTPAWFTSILYMWLIYRYLNDSGQIGNCRHDNQSKRCNKQSYLHGGCVELTNLRLYSWFRRTHSRRLHAIIIWHVAMQGRSFIASKVFNFDIEVKGTPWIIRWLLNCKRHLCHSMTNKMR